jgi:hypothetical protein
MLAPSEAPALASSESFVLVPSEAPALAPIEAPVLAPIEAPVLAPIEAPVFVPSEAPVFVPSEAPALTRGSCFDSQGGSYVGSQRGPCFDSQGGSCVWLPLRLLLGCCCGELGLFKFSCAYKYGVLVQIHCFFVCCSIFVCGCCLQFLLYECDCHVLKF